jgi:glycosyltransferase involved in cell wall biosynthesis
VTVVQVLALNPCKFGSMEDYVLQLGTAMVARGDCFVVVFEQMPYEGLLAKFYEAGIQVIALRPNSSTENFYLALFRLFRKLRPAIVHFHFYSQFSWFPLVAKAAVVRKVFFTEHIRQPMHFGKLKRLRLKIWDALIFGVLNVTILAISQYIKRVLVSDYSVRESHIKLLNNGVDLTRFTISGEHRHRSVPRLISTSNLRPEKGIHILIRALAQVRKKHDCELWIVGDGPERVRLETLAEELGLSNAISFLGIRSDVAQLVQNSDVLIIPSLWQEPSGLVALEALACGVPVIASSVGGLPEIVTSDSGILVESADVEGLAQAINNLITDLGLARRMGERGRQLVEENFSMTRWVTNTIANYDHAS